MYVSANYGFLSCAITKLETVGLSLCEQMGVLADVKTKISEVTGNCSSTIQTKLQKVLENNEGLRVMETICTILAGEEKIHEQYTLAETSSFKYAPITSVDVERTFSVYKSLLRDNRQGFSMENLSTTFVIYCNSNMHTLF